MNQKYLDRPYIHTLNYFWKCFCFWGDIHENSVFSKQFPGIDNQQLRNFRVSLPVRFLNYREVIPGLWKFPVYLPRDFSISRSQYLEIALKKNNFSEKLCEIGEKFEKYLGIVTRTFPNFWVTMPRSGNCCVSFPDIFQHPGNNTRKLRNLRVSLLRS